MKMLVLKGQILQPVLISFFKDNKFSCGTIEFIASSNFFKSNLVVFEFLSKFCMAIKILVFY